MAFDSTGRYRQMSLIPRTEPITSRPALSAAARHLAVSLFSSAGIGELGLKANGVSIVASSEIDADRHELYSQNFKDTRCFQGDIWQRGDELVSFYQENYGKDELFLVYATPPCQGMSSNGAGRLAFEAKHGRRGIADERNRLVIPTMDVIAALEPRWILLENVPRMLQTRIQDEFGAEVGIVDYIRRRLGATYDGRAEVLACSDFGIPQTRKRLITVFTRDENGKRYFRENGGTFFPGYEKTPPITLREAISQLPPLEAREGREANRSFHPLHFVPKMGDEKYWWVANTPEGETAYNNQCVSPTCGYKLNPLHRDVENDGVWQSNKETPIFCVRCGSLLPRPSMIDRKTGQRRLLKGFHSAYRRMEWDKPARALTQNFIYEASDNKIHPDQNRVLSIYEALKLQTILDYEYDFTLRGQTISPAFFAELIGESVPPKLIDFVVRKALHISEKSDNSVRDSAVASYDRSRRRRVAVGK